MNFGNSPDFFPTNPSIEGKKCIRDATDSEIFDGWIEVETFGLVKKWSKKLFN